MSNVVKFPRRHVDPFSDLMRRHFKSADKISQNYMNWLDERLADAKRRRSEWPFDEADIR